MSGALVDTNVIVYAHDPSDPAKHQRAIDLIADLSRDDRLVVSAQVLNELAWVLLRKKEFSNQTPDSIRQIINDLAAAAHVLPLTQDLTFMALGILAGEGLSFWDALIWAAARQHGISTIYTEDYQHDREVEGVRFLNPFVDLEAFHPPRA